MLTSSRFHLLHHLWALQIFHHLLWFFNTLMFVSLQDLTVFQLRLPNLQLNYTMHSYVVDLSSGIGKRVMLQQFICLAVGIIRPISVVPVLVKILDKLVASQLSVYFEQFQLVSQYQGAHWVGGSTEQILLFTMDLITQLAWMLSGSHKGIWFTRSCYTLEVVMYLRCLWHWND